MRAGAEQVREGRQVSSLHLRKCAFWSDWYQFCTAHQLFDTPPIDQRSLCAQKLANPTFQVVYVLVMSCLYALRCACVLGLVADLTATDIVSQAQRLETLSQRTAGGPSKAKPSTR
jgi:hypothetical protein